MASKGRKSRVTVDQELTAGMKASFDPKAALVLKGETHTIAELIGMLDARVAAAAPVAAAKDAWQALVDKERTLIEQTQPVIDALRQYLVIVNGDKPGALTKFGIATHTRRALTSEQLAARTQKARATRDAKKQKATHAPASPTPAAPNPTGGH
jgi:hypothetical protein